MGCARFTPVGSVAVGWAVGVSIVVGCGREVCMAVGVARIVAVGSGVSATGSGVTEDASVAVCSGACVTEA